MDDTTEYQLRLYSTKCGNVKKIHAYILRKSSFYTDDQSAYLENEVKECKLQHLIYQKDFHCKDPYSRMLRVILETEYRPRIKEIDRSKVDEMSHGEKKVFTLPKNTTKLKAIVIDEKDNLLLTAILDGTFSQLDPSQETRPGVEGDDTTELLHQYICIMLVVYTLYISTVRQPVLR